MTSHETRFRVRYAETDQMGVVYYANYLIWMEIGRAEYCRAAGIRYKDMETDDGVRLAVVDAHCHICVRRATTKKLSLEPGLRGPIEG